MIFLTYNDSPSGVYFSQVTDVCNFVNAQFKCKIRLVSLISIRGFSRNKMEILKQCPNAIVLPLFPKNKNWRLNKFTLIFLFLFLGKQSIWCRGIFATNIAIELKKQKWANKVVFDARGAYEAEFSEYLNKIVLLKDNINLLEKNAIVNSDYKIAVSESLLKYWETNYKFFGSNYQIIPCTLAENHLINFPEKKILELKREELGIKANDIVFIYSGSTADWQSLDLVDKLMFNIFLNCDNAFLIILSAVQIDKLEISKEFQNRIIHKLVKPGEVINYLLASDFGILIRENSVTNKVASPVKFAEYLNAGLKVLISEHLGDFSNFISKNKCGNVISDLDEKIKFEAVEYSQKLEFNKLARNNFTKNNFVVQYKTVIDQLNL